MEVITAKVPHQLRSTPDSVLVPTRPPSGYCGLLVSGLSHQPLTGHFSGPSRNALVEHRSDPSRVGFGGLSAKNHFSAHPLLLLLLDSRALVLMICEGLRASFRALTAAHGEGNPTPCFTILCAKNLRGAPGSLIPPVILFCRRGASTLFSAFFNFSRFFCLQEANLRVL